MAGWLVLPGCSSGMADGYRNVQFYTGSGTLRRDLLTHLVCFDSSVIDANGVLIPHTDAETAKIQELIKQEKGLE